MTSEMRCCCEDVTGGFRITLLLMIIKRTICAKPLRCLLFSPHMEWVFYLLLFWKALRVWIVHAIKMHSKYGFVFFFFIMQTFLLTEKADKRYTVVHHLGYKVHHQAQHQAPLSNMVQHDKDIFPTVTFEVHNECKERSKCKHKF